MQATTDKAIQRGATSMHRIDDAIQRCVRSCLLLQQTNSRGEPIWNLYSPLSPSWVSMFLFGLEMLQEESQAFDHKKFREILLTTILPNGSWCMAKDPTLKEGDIDTTLWNHIALMLLPPLLKDDPSTKRALRQSAEFIRQKGGIEKTNGLSKIMLAIAGLYPWKWTFPIPLFVFDPSSVVYVKKLAATWIYPFVLPIALLRHLRTVLPLQSSTSLDHLWTRKPSLSVFCDVSAVSEAAKKKLLHTSSVQILLHEMLSIWDLGGDGTKDGECVTGSMGNYTASTLLALFVSREIQTYTPNHDLAAKFALGAELGMHYIEKCYYAPNNTLMPYWGCVMDGSTWDSLYMSLALASSGNGHENVVDLSVQRLCRECVGANGGVGFGYSFEDLPDADDTSIFVTLLAAASKGDVGPPGRYHEQILSSWKWLKAIQNVDGGFPAFTHNLNGSALWKFIFWCTGLTNATEFFDPSCADITGHFLESAGAIKKDITEPAVARAVDFLKRTQDQCGAWEGRWGVNFIYAVGAVLPGLQAIGYSSFEDPWICRAVGWLVSVQNEDGGFGETIESYTKPELAGRGVSTVSQTCWACSALLAVHSTYDVDLQIEKAVHFLLRNSECTTSPHLSDVSYVGTGHRGLVSMQYPVYSKTLPILVLTKYKKQLLESSSQHTRKRLKVSSSPMKVDTSLSASLQKKLAVLILCISAIPLSIILYKSFLPSMEENKED